jgi:hypothetical protein
MAAKTRQAVIFNARLRIAHDVMHFLRAIARPVVENA